jgi:hypothetical protein
VGSGLMILGTFDASATPSETIKTFKSAGTGLVVTSAIEFSHYYGKSKPVPIEVKLAIAVGAKENEDPFNAVDSAEASTRFEKRWNLSASKNIEFADKIYTFSISCAEKKSR